MRDYARFWLITIVGALLGLAGCGGGREDDPDPEPPEEAFAAPIRCEGHTSSVGSAAVSPDGKLVASGSDDGTLRFWDASSGKPIRTVRPPLPPGEVLHSGGGRKFYPGDAPPWVGALAFAPDGKALAASVSAVAVRIYDPATGAPHPACPLLREWSSGMAFSPDGKSLAVADNAEVRVCGLPKGDRLAAFALPQTEPYGGLDAIRVAFSPNGEYLAAGLRGRGSRVEMAEGPLVRVWRIATRQEVFATSHGHACNAVAFSPDGKLLAFNGGGGEVEVCAWASGKRVVRFRADPRTVFCLAFSPDGKTLFTGGNDPEVKLWRAATGKPMGTLKGHAGQVSDIALSKDGTVMATAGRDKRVMIWHRGARQP